MRGLRLIQVRLRVGGSDLLAGFDLDVAPGAVTTVMGPSGCGKSSLLGYVCGTLEPVFEASSLAGRAAIHELPRAAAGRHPVPGRSAVSSPVGRREPGRCRRPAWPARAACAHRGGAGRGGSGRLRSARPSTLSGGQRARGPDAHAVAEPRALLLDEPFGKLDRPLRDRFRRFVFEHARAAGLPTLLVTRRGRGRGRHGRLSPKRSHRRCTTWPCPASGAARREPGRRPPRRSPPAPAKLVPRRVGLCASGRYPGILGRRGALPWRS